MKTATIYAKARGGLTVVRVLIRPNHPGFQWHSRQGDESGDRFVREVICTHAGRKVFSASLSRWMPSDPSFEFRIRNARKGEALQLWWRDSAGDTRSIQSVIF